MLLAENKGKVNVECTWNPLLSAILLMCAAHISKLILEKFYRNFFTISNKNFSKIGLLMCVLRAHINRILSSFINYNFNNL